jgi:hypothetical protein
MDSLGLLEFRLAKTFFVKTLRSRPQFQYADPADQHEIWGPTLTP